MYRPAARTALRSSQCSLAPARTAGRRYLTTEPPHVRSRTWKSSALRWGIAAAAIYYYNTSSVFAEYPQNNLLNPNVDALDDEKRHPTLDQLTASSRNKAQKDASTLQSVIEQTSDSAEVQRQENEQALSPSPIPGHSSDSMTGGAADLEAEAESEGAFNPVTGEINWDCPCLGGMAYGPCGDEFRAAFSCFVYSNEDPKGMECIDKFQGMQDCFRAHPEVYKGEIEDDEALDGELAEEKEQLQKEIQERRAQVEQRNLLDEPEPTSTDETTAAKKASKNKASSTSSSKKPAATNSQSSSSSDTPQPEAKTTSHTPEEYSLNKETKHGAPSQQVSEPQTPRNDANAVSETESLVPKAAHDARDSDPARSHSKAVDM